MVLRSTAGVDAQTQCDAHAVCTPGKAKALFKSKEEQQETTLHEPNGALQQLCCGIQLIMFRIQQLRMQ